MGYRDGMERVANDDIENNATMRVRIYELRI